MCTISHRPVYRSFSFADALQPFLLQDGLPFSQVLAPERIATVFQKHRSLFGGIYTTAITLWAFIGQVLRDGKQAACQAAVANVVAYCQLTGKPAPTHDTGDYCVARAKLSEHALRELSCDVAADAQSDADSAWLWQGRNAYLVDGFTLMMADTPENQAEYPQHTAQKPGVGFPIARVLSILSLATGCLVDAAVGPFAGKGTGETALLRKLLDVFKPGDVVVADRYFCNYWLIAMLMQRSVHVCFRKHQKRPTDFRKGKRLGWDDHLVSWVRPSRPSWMSAEQYASMPERIALRELRYVISAPGRKQSSIIVISTFVQDQGEEGVSFEAIAELYSFRWNAELDIRSIKTFLNLNHLRCKTPAMVRREFWTTMLAYNLIRVVIAGAAALHERRPREISFTTACQYVLVGWLNAMLNLSEAERLSYSVRLLEQIAACCIANRPDRFEPRVVKKRRDSYRLMMEPRPTLRARLLKGDNLFET